MRQIIREIQDILIVSIILFIFAGLIWWLITGCIVPFYKENCKSDYELIAYQQPIYSLRIDDIDILLMYYHTTDSYKIRHDITQYVMNNKLLEGRKKWRRLARY